MLTENGKIVLQGGKWIVLQFNNHITIQHTGKLITRVHFVNKGFTFYGKNPLKFPKIIQKQINEFMEQRCKAEKMAVWDCEAWTDYDNTPLKS